MAEIELPDELKDGDIGPIVNKARRNLDGAKHGVTVESPAI